MQYAVVQAAVLEVLYDTFAKGFLACRSQVTLNCADSLGGLIRYQSTNFYQTELQDFFFVPTNPRTTNVLTDYVAKLKKLTVTVGLMQSFPMHCGAAAMGRCK